LLKVTGYSLFVAFNCAFSGTILYRFELTPLVVSSISKIAFNIYGSEET